MELDELIKEVEKYVICSKLDLKDCVNEYEYCKDCPYDAIPLDDLMPRILHFLRTLQP